MRHDRDRRVYHFTHVDNLPAILGEDALLADTALDARALVADVGDLGVKASRRRRRVPLVPGGVVADFVPFYFAPRSPMLYRIVCDHRAGTAGRYAGGEDPLIYLVTSVGRVADSGRPWVASDGNAAAFVSRFTTEAAELETLVDWPLMEEKIWANDADDPDRQRRRMAELLVHRRLPLATLLGYATKTEQMARRVKDILATDGRFGDYIAVRSSWYYERRGR